MAVTVEEVNKDICTGCGGCLNVCPVNAISMKADEKGFLFPSVNKEICILCGACCKKCPALHTAQKFSKEIEIYAAYAADDIRAQSSSGGIFTALAKYAFSKSGAVAGAAWTDGWKVKHIVIRSENELDRLRRSKYLQSDTGDTFRQTKKLLDQQVFVLYSGCPCQIAGLYSYLGKEYDNLLTADIVCHGVPSPLALKKYLEELSAGKEIRDVNFRDKSHGWGTPSSVSFSDGTKYFKGCNDDPYYIGFLNGITTRSSCSTCKYASPERIGDIALGDFWGVSEIDPKYNDNKGTSLVVVNTAKGKKCFNEIKPQLKLCEAVPKERVIEISKRRNGQFIAPRASHKNRERFFHLMNEENFSKAISEATEKKFDIGVVGWWYNDNYGGTLTYYALHQLLRSMGYSVLMIEKAASDPGYVPNYSTIPRRFAKKYYSISQIYHPYKMGVLNGVCSAFISGSDQLFSPYLWEYSGPPYYLDFAAPDKNMISYASSFGNSYAANEKFKMTVSYYLRRFNALSVREDYAVDIMRDNFGLEAKKVLDPVFVCDPIEYDKLIEKSELRLEEKYFANFILDPDEGKKNAILHAKAKLGLSFINLIHAIDFEANSKKLGLENIKPDLDVEDFLNYYKNAEFIITDSYHGTCFAIIFRKPFISIANKQRGIGRFVSMLSELGLQNRMVNDVSEIYSRPELFEKVDYTEAEKRLHILKKDSYDWLKNALSAPKSKALSNFQIMDHKQNINNNKVIRLQEEVFELRKKIDELYGLLGKKQ